MCMIMGCVNEPDVFEMTRIQIFSFRSLENPHTCRHTLTQMYTYSKTWRWCHIIRRLHNFEFQRLTHADTLQLWMLSPLAIITKLRLQTQHPAICHLPQPRSGSAHTRGQRTTKTNTGWHTLTFLSCAGNIPAGGGHYVWVWRSFCPCRKKEKLFIFCWPLSV